MIFLRVGAPGGLGVGKSRLARQMQSERPNSVLIDADALKEFIPEYARFKGEDLDTAWLRVHSRCQYELGFFVSGHVRVIRDGEDFGVAEIVTCFRIVVPAPGRIQ